VLPRWLGGVTGRSSRGTIEPMPARGGMCGKAPWCVQRLVGCCGAAMFLLFGCTRHTELLLAVHAKHDPVGPLPCEIESANPPGALRDLKWAGRTLVYEAVSAGRAVVRCHGEKTLVTILRPVRVEIVAPGRVRVGERFRVELRAIDASGRALVVGKYADLEWEIGGALRADNRGSCEFPPWCEQGFWARGDRVGSGTVAVKWDTLRASTTVSVRGAGAAAPDAGRLREMIEARLQ